MLRRLLCVFIFIFTISTTYAADANFLKRQDVQTFIQMMVKKHHFSRQYLENIFSTVKIRPQVMQHIKKPLEKETWSTYQKLFVSEWRIENGVKFWDKYAAALSKAERTFGVPASIIVATIGVETRYGERTGDFRVIDSLSNIAFSDSTRAKFFKSELEEFLLLSRDQHLNPLEVMGSYAGAIGQPQFMPSSYRYYAVNFSGSGKTDLVHNEVDVIGSVANYYKKHGWKTGEPVAVPAVAIGKRYDYLMSKNKITQPISMDELAKYGIIPRKSGDDFDLKVKVIELQSKYSKEYWLGFHNFSVIKRYNPSDLYAMAVYQLSSRIASLRKKENS